MGIEKYDIRKLKRLQQKKKRGTLDKRMEPYFQWLKRRVENKF